MKTNAIKTLMVILVCFFLTGQATAQQSIPWSPPGAQWIYVYSSLQMGQFMVMSYERDSVINSQPVKVMEIKKWLSINPFAFTPFVNEVYTEYMYENNGIVYWWDGTTFKTLYNFTAQVGDKWETPVHPYTGETCNTDSIEVTRVVNDSIRNNGDTISIIETSTAGVWTFHTIIKGIGSTHGIFPAPANLFFSDSLSGCTSTQQDGFLIHLGFLTHYRDSIRGHIVGVPDSYSDILLSTASKSPNLSTARTSELRVYPNPAMDLFYFDFPNVLDTWNLQVFDMLGKQVIFQNDVEDNRVEITHLAKGLYVVRLQASSGETYLAKLLKN